MKEEKNNGGQRERGREREKKQQQRNRRPGRARVGSVAPNVYVRSHAFRSVTASWRHRRAANALLLFARCFLSVSLFLSCPLPLSFLCISPSPRSFYRSSGTFSKARGHAYSEKDCGKREGGQLRGLPRTKRPRGKAREKETE